MGSMADEQLVDLIRQGDEAAYRTLMERYQDYVYTLIYRMVDHRETAEDLTQEVFLKLFRAIERFRGDSLLKTWIYRLTVNLVADYRRSRKRRPYEAILDKVKGWFGDRKEEPEAKALEKEERQTVQDLLAALPYKYKLVLYLYHYKQLTYQEISDVTGLPIKTVETRLYRGKMMLKQKWLEVGGHDWHSSKRSRAATFTE
jgi:RNA polymerase sigma factor (sigma-70 family)